jgi:hypothetical protein
MMRVNLARESIPALWDYFNQVALSPGLHESIIPKPHQPGQATRKPDIELGKTDDKTSHSASFDHLEAINHSTTHVGVRITDRIR